MTDGLPFSILIVEDDQDDRMIIDEAFKEIGYDQEVRKFADGKALFCYLDQTDPSLYPSLIVLDYTLPQLNATDIVALLKRDASYKAIPVVVYTTTLPDSKKEQLLAQGVNSCFKKGTTTAEIIKLVKELKVLAEKKVKVS